MKKKLEKVINYYRYNGFKNTMKALFRKLFPGFRKNNNNEMAGFDNFELELSEEDKPNIVLKNKRKVFIFATIPYYDVGGGQRSSQFAKIFDRMGYIVHYYFAFPTGEGKVHYMPIYASTHKYIDFVTPEDLKNVMTPNDICIFEAPIKKFEPFFNLAKTNATKTVYENIDNWETSLGSMFFSEDTLKLMVKDADMLVATTKLLVEQVENYFVKYDITKRDVTYLPNAVDDFLFEPKKEYDKPKDLKIGTKTLLYYGSLWGDWFDWQLISDVAKSNPDITINLIGDMKLMKYDRKQLPKNIHFLGLKRQMDLPNYLVYTDYAILPFKCCDIGNYVSPLKIFEYIAMNKIVLATTLPDIEGYPNTYTSNEAKDWIDVINKDIEVDTHARDEFINDNNWNDRCTKIIDKLFSKELEKIREPFYNNISIVTLNYNNMKVIFRLVDSLLKYNDRYKYEIIVVDNVSSDGSYEKLQEVYGDKIILKRNDKNGCSSGRNLGVQSATKDYILFLDSDEWVLNKYFLDNYIDILEEHNEVGAIGWGAGFFNEKGYAFKTVDGYVYRYMPVSGLFRKDIGYLATCGFFMKRELFDKIGGFDTYYDPTGYEDTDLSLKVRNAGFETVYSPYLGVGHIPHQTTKSGTDAHTKLLQDKGTYFRNKWMETNKELIFKYTK